MRSPTRPLAAWRHHDARAGLELVFIRPLRRGWRFDGHATAVDDSAAWTVRYRITVDLHWHTRAAQAWLWSEAGAFQRSLRGDGTGRWEVDGARVPALDGCLDVDFEASACTNTFPVHRLHLADDAGMESPAAYVRVPDLAVERLEQRYTRRSPTDYDYEAPTFDFRCRLEYDGSGLVLRYPGIATRVS